MIVFIRVVGNTPLFRQDANRFTNGFSLKELFP